MSSNKTGIDPTDQLSNNNSDRKFDSKVIKNLKYTNTAYTINTFVRPIGSAQFDFLQRKILFLFSKSRALDLFGLMETLRGICHTIGMIHGYLKIAGERDTN